MTVTARTIVGGAGDEDTDVLVDGVTVDAVAGDVQLVAGAETVDAAIVSKPILTAGRASTAVPTAVSADNEIQLPWLDRSGRQIIGGTQTEDVAHTDGDLGVMALAVRRDADTSLVGTTGDYAPLQVDDLGALKVNVRGLETPAGDSVIDEGNNAVQVSIISDSAHPTAYLEDGAHTTGDPGEFILAVRRDADTSLVDTTGDYAPLQVNALGALKVADGGGSLTVDGTVTANLAAGTNNIGDVDVLTLPNVTLAAGTNTNEVVGDVAHDAAAAGNPVLIAARADTTQPAAVSDADATYLWSDEYGTLVVRPSARQLDIAVTPTIDTAVYASGDRLGSVMTFAGCALVSGGTGTVVKAILHDEAASNLEIWLHLFKVSPTLANADNGVLDITDANLATAVYVATVKFLTTDTKLFGTSNRVCEGTWLGGPPAIGYTTSGSSSLFGVLEARGAYDAVATDDIIVTLSVIRD